MADLISGQRAWWIIGALAALAALTGVFTIQPLDRDESRYVQATTQMLETGDFVEIRFQDEARNKKPVGIYWLQAVTAGLLTSDAERPVWAYRLPSVLGAIMAALGCFWAGTRFMSREAAFAAASLFAVSILLASEGGIAKTDAMLSGATTLAMAALLALRHGGGRRDALVFWVMLGLGVLVKGPVTPMVAGLAILALLVWERKPGWLRPLLFWPGPILAALIVLPWLIAVQLATDGEFLREAIGVDLAPRLTSGLETHGGMPGYHLLTLSVLSFPFIFFLVPGFRAALPGLRDTNSDQAKAIRFLLAWIIPSWIVFELMPTKLPHYPLPVYAALALIAGLGWQAFSATPLWTRLTSITLGLLGSVVLIALILAASIVYGGSPVLAGIAAAICVMAILAVIIAIMRKQGTAALMLAIFAGLSWHVQMRMVAVPLAQDLNLSERAAQTVADMTGQSGRDAVSVISSYNEPSLVFALGTETRLVAFDEMGDAVIAQSGAFVSIEDTARSGDDMATLEQIETGVCERREVPGYNYSRGEETVLIVRLHNCEQG
ncbi:glycosyltransferase family 39 protein [Hyphobacterium sp. HN65]|uniref:Glycosyltransferase family 39 protein n=1 Tax=Hyphobacterium lacteum TaxID=3116575 RepID=A0ABU7LQ23_9PROT|nr:glycosyltransferase family 39 protein [Hyphobacterium sp. HN65]MEE2525988.1 glycosyltransferase family 39 protein [Hyphobacterium sp. HN65]